MHRKLKKRCGFDFIRSTAWVNTLSFYLYQSAIVSERLEEEINLSQQCQQYFWVTKWEQKFPIWQTDKVQQGVRLVIVTCCEVEPFLLVQPVKSWTWFICSRETKISLHNCHCLSENKCLQMNGSYDGRWTLQTGFTSHLVSLKSQEHCRYNCWFWQSGGWQGEVRMLIKCSRLKFMTLLGGKQNLFDCDGLLVYELLEYI